MLEATPFRRRQSYVPLIPSLSRLPFFTVAAARCLLERSSLSVKEMSARVGYAHASEFSKDSKVECGATPSRWRHETRDHH
jgi:methylphosphotriester-DNA--protein-cysteine methyltransferase